MNPPVPVIVFGLKNAHIYNNLTTILVAVSAKHTKSASMEKSLTRTPADANVFIDRFAQILTFTLILTDVGVSAIVNVQLHMS